MILILKNVDFSSNNIGKISITNLLTDETLRILQSYTKYPAEQANEYVQALNSLIKGLTDEGLYNKISVLAVPSMASSLEECRKNVINDSTIANSTLFDSLYSLDGKGMRKTATIYEDKANTCGYSISHNSDNFTMFGIYYTDTGEVASEQICGGRIAGWYGFKNTYKYISAGPSGQITSGGNNVAPQGGEGSFLTPSYMVSMPFVLSYVSGAVYYKDKRLSRTGSYAIGNQSLVQFSPLLTGSSGTASLGAMMLYGCGYGLTESEVAKMYSLLADFYTAVLA